LARTLKASDEKYRAILESIEEPYYEVDLKGDLVLINAAFCRLLGYPESELLGLNNRAYQSPTVAVNVYETFNEVYRTGMPKMGYDWQMLRKDGSKVTVEGSVHLAKDDQGRPVGFRGMLRDVTARRQADAALRASEERFRSLTQLSSDWYWEQDRELRFLRFEGRNKEHLDHFVGKKLQELNVELDGSDIGVHLATKEAHRPFRDVEMSYFAGGQHRCVSVSGEPVFDGEGNFTGYHGVARDITERKQSEKEIQYLATHDDLTGLPNRSMFRRMLNLAIESAQSQDLKLAVLFIDLDRFKVINDSLGHQLGDMLLKETAQRLKDVCAWHSVGRLGGDEFVVLVQEIAEVEEVSEVARNILAAVVEPMILMGQECRVTASIGIAVYPSDGLDGLSLKKNADIAMYRAKEEGKNIFRFYSSEVMGRQVERLMLETGLRHALERGEFFLHYQPKHDLGSGYITGVEALLRWDHPELGTVSPRDFIPLAEDTGLIVPIGKWVLEAACAQAMQWQRQCAVPISIAVNLSARQMRDDNLIEDVSRALRDSGLPAQLLELEITESMMMQNVEHAIRLLTEIRKMGIRIALDDFGTGYSSMALLKRFPIDTLKIDGAFVREVPGNTGDNAIVDAIIGMGKALRLRVVAEGVETAEQAAFLRAHACDEIQGYHFSKAVGADEIMGLVQNQMIAQLKSIPVPAASHDLTPARAAARTG
jgi:diguanylate cyclase (GGDEF)-like protein/PAS domain S-box-containing protein